MHVERAHATDGVAVLRRERWRDSLVLALAWRYAAHAAMVACALASEPRPAPHVPDLVLDHLPRVEWIASHNYHLWLALYLPPALWLWRADRAAFVRFLWIGGVLSLLRGACVPLTGLGPAWGADANAGAGAATLARAWLAIVNPWTALAGDAAHVSLTKDLFFSGHASTTFLLWLYCLPHARLGALALVTHVLVVASVFLAHLHYTIDVVGAWAITYSVWTLAERRRVHSTFRS